MQSLPLNDPKVFRHFAYKLNFLLMLALLSRHYLQGLLVETALWYVPPGHDRKTCSTIKKPVLRFMLPIRIHRLRS